jgi:hypothetical protein
VGDVLIFAGLACYSSFMEQGYLKLLCCKVIRIYFSSLSADFSVPESESSDMCNLNMENCGCSIRGLKKPVVLSVIPDILLGYFIVLQNFEICIPIPDSGPFATTKS